MKRYVKQILDSIYNEPEEWKPYVGIHGWDSIKLDKVIVRDSGITKVYSVIDLLIDNRSMILNGLDKYRLEKAVIWWYSRVNLNVFNDC